jgi:hypothetical protein
MTKAVEVEWRPYTQAAHIGQGYEMQNPQTKPERVRLQVRRDGYKGADAISDTTLTRPFFGVESSAMTRPGIQELKISSASSPSLATGAS